MYNLLKIIINFIGMYDAGMGETNVNTFLSALNVPVVADKCLKRYEREVVPEIEKLAEQSCRDAITMEKTLTEENIRAEK